MTWHPYPPPEVPWSGGRLVNNDRVSVPGLHGVVVDVQESTWPRERSGWPFRYKWRWAGK